jgi:hypothetical protein
MITQKTTIIATVIILILFCIYFQSNKEHLTNNSTISLDAIQNISSLYANGEEFVVPKLKVLNDASIDGSVNSKNITTHGNINTNGSITVQGSSQSTIFNGTDGVNHISGTTRFENGLVEFTNTEPIEINSLNVSTKINTKTLLFNGNQIEYLVINTVDSMDSHGIERTIDNCVCIIAGYWPANKSHNGACMWVDVGGQWCYKAWGMSQISIMVIPKGLCENSYQIDANGSYKIVAYNETP